MPIPVRRFVVPVLLLLGTSFLAPRRAAGQRPDMHDPDFSQAVAALLTYDHFAAKCAATKGLSANDAAQVEAWRSANRIDLLRMRLAELDSDPVQREQVDQARAAVVKKYGNLSFLACRATLQSTKRPEAQFAANAPRMLAALGVAASPPGGTAVAGASPAPATASAPGVSSGGAVGASAAATAVATAAAAPTATTTPATTVAAAAPPPTPRAPLLEQVDSFGFDTRAKMGVGGFMTLDIYPIVLFATGEALIDVTGLSFPAGLEAHRRANPDDWTRWRRAGGSLQLAKERGWEKPAFQATYPRLPDGFRLDGFFRALSGAGTLAVGGTQEVVAWREYRFWSDGRVVRGGGAGGRAEAGNAAVATSSVAPDRRGRYRIEGLMLQISYDDGSVESRMLIADPNDPKTAIWLDGVGYVRRPPPR